MEDVPAFGFHFESGQGAGFGGGDGDAEAEGGAEFLGEGGGGICGGFDGEAELGEGGALVDLHLILADFRESANDRVDGTRVDVDAADHDHVVGAAEDAALQREMVAVGNRADEVAGAVAEKRRAVAAEGGQDEFAVFSMGDGLAGGGIDDFAELRFVP